jgi:hypothetical protein
MGVIAISIDTKNPTEVLGCYGILALDFLLDRQITRSRFVESTDVKVGTDGEFRTGTFEFEHPAFDGLLTRCRGMKLHEENDQVIVESEGRLVLAFDWFQSGSLFMGDYGNFSKELAADSGLRFIKTHHQVLCDIIDGRREPEELFSIAIKQNSPHYLSSYSSHKMDFLDAGGAYERVDLFYASEWFLLFALQVFRHYCEGRLKNDHKLCYATYGEWLPTTASFAAMTGTHYSSKRYEALCTQFGKGLVLKAVQEV